MRTSAEGHPLSQRKVSLGQRSYRSTINVNVGGWVDGLMGGSIDIEPLKRFLFSSVTPTDASVLVSSSYLHSSQSTVPQALSTFTSTTCFVLSLVPCHGIHIWYSCFWVHLKNVSTINPHTRADKWLQFDQIHMRCIRAILFYSFLFYLFCPQCPLTNIPTGMLDIFNKPPFAYSHWYVGLRSRSGYIWNTPVIRSLILVNFIEALNVFCMWLP